MIPYPVQEKLAITSNTPAARLDRWLAAQWPAFSRARWQKAIAAGLVEINGKPVRASETVRVGDLVEALPPTPENPTTTARPEPIPIDIIHEDAHLLCINKPPGLVVHPAAGHWEGTLVNAILHHCGDQIFSGSHPIRPGIVHRLDKDTSGCILVAKTADAHQVLARQFADRTALKTYLAVVRGKPRATAGVITGALARHPVHRQRMAVTRREGARDAETSWWLLCSTGRLSLLECRPKTGRTHQIRVHLKHIGHPVAGDRVYGGGADFPRQLLHAWQIRITHPFTGEPLVFEAPVPDEFPLRPLQAPE